MIHRDPNGFCKRAYFCGKVQQFYVTVYDSSIWWPPEELQVLTHQLRPDNFAKLWSEKLTENPKEVQNVSCVTLRKITASSSLWRSSANEKVGGSIPSCSGLRDVFISVDLRLKAFRCRKVLLWVRHAQEPSIYQLKPRPQKSLHHSAFTLRSLSPGAVPAGNASHNEISNSCKSNSFTSLCSPGPVWCHRERAE